MSAHAYLKNFRVSPRKARLVADQIRGRGVEEALAILDLSPKRSARAMAKLVRSAVANAEVAARAQEVDPDNRLLHRQNVRRIPAEAIRDHMLLVAGRLDETMGGAPVPIHLTAFMQGRGRPAQSGPLDGANRRTLYIAVRRNFLSPMLSSFDRPSPFSCVGRRNQTNVPGQALILLNDPFVHEMANALEGRLLAEAPADAESRIAWLGMVCLGRVPDAETATRLREWVEARITAGEQPDNAWGELCHAMFNLKAFIWLD